MLYEICQVIFILPDRLSQFCSSKHQLKLPLLCPVALLLWKPWRRSMGAVVIDISGSQVVRVLAGKQASASLIQRMNHCWGRPEGSWYSDSYLSLSPPLPPSCPRTLNMAAAVGQSDVWPKRLWMVDWRGLLMPCLVTPGYIWKVQGANPFLVRHKDLGMEFS